MKLVVLGHCNIDVQLRVAKLPPPGASTPVTDRRDVYGGTASNIARQAAGLGVPVRLWSRVGPDFPSAWRAALHADGVELALDEIEGGRTPTCFIFTDDHDTQSYCMDQGAMTPPYAVPAAVLDGATHLHIGTGDPAAYQPVAERARKAGMHISFDPGQEIHFAYTPGQFERLLDTAHTFFCNEAELDKALSFLRYGDPEQLLDHVDTVVVTRGVDGASLHRAGKKRHDAPALPAAPVDPTGAGDALRAGWYAAIAAGHDMVEALRWGQAAASLIIEHLGPQAHVLSNDELQARLAT